MALPTDVVAGNKILAAHVNELIDNVEIHATDALQHSNDAEKTDTNAAYVKKKETQLDSCINGDAVRIKFDLKSGDGVQTAYGKIYRNGGAIGVERSNATGVYITYSEDFDCSGWSATDLIQIYIHCNGAIAALVENFRFYFSLWEFTNQDP